MKLKTRNFGARLQVAFLRQNETLCAVDDLLDRSQTEKRKSVPSWQAKVAN